MEICRVTIEVFLLEVQIGLPVSARSNPGRSGGRQARDYLMGRILLQEEPCESSSRPFAPRTYEFYKQFSET